MTLVMPEGVPTLGATKVKGVISIASQTAPKLATEINVATSVDLSLFLYPAGWSPTGNTAKGTRPVRLGSKKEREIFNRTTWSLGALQYVYDPQAIDTAPGNAAKALLVEGAVLHLLERLGLDAETVAFAIGDRTRDHWVRCGPQIPSGDRTDENGEFYMMQELIYVNSLAPVDGVVVA